MILIIVKEAYLNEDEIELNFKLCWINYLKGLRNDPFVMYNGTKDNMTQLASNNSQSECNLIMNLWEKK